MTTASLCVQVGWSMRILYAGDFPEAVAPPAAGQLPAVEQLTPAEIVGVHVSQISAAIAKIVQAEGWADDLSTEVKGIADAAANQDSVAAYVKAPGGADALSVAIRSLHLGLLRQLQSGPGLAKAYALGQSLSELGTLETAEQLDSAFAAAAVVALDRQLNDLATVLPAHAAKCVAQSLTWWRDLVAVSQQGRSVTTLFETLKGTRSDAPALRRTPQSNGPLIAKAPHAEGLASNLIAVLPRQTERWRTILVGAKDPLDLLKPEDYLNAGRRLFGRTRDVIRKVPAPLWVVFVIVTAVFLGVLGLAVYLPTRSPHAQETTKFTASFTATFATIAAYLATLWKGILPRIQSMLTGLEKPMWNGALDFVCAEAVSLPPVGAEDREQWSELAKVANGSIQAANAAITKASADNGDSKDSAS